MLREESAKAWYVSGENRSMKRGSAEVGVFCPPLRLFLGTCRRPVTVAHEATRHRPTRTGFIVCECPATMAATGKAAEERKRRVPLRYQTPPWRSH